MFQVRSTISKINTMGDHSLRLQVDVDKELTPEENTMVFELYNKPGYFIFKEVEITSDDIIDIRDEVKEFKTEKSPSEILRNRLFIYYSKPITKKKVSRLGVKLKWTELDYIT